MGTWCPMADSDSDRSDVLQRAEQAQARSKALRERIAEAAEMIAATEQESAGLAHHIAGLIRSLSDHGS
jgi:hypothetical protein